MIDQLQKHTNATFDLFTLTLEEPVRPDENFYEDEQQLADDLATPLPEELENQPQPEIDPDAFDELYAWFLT
jgi:hypothetical protein